MDTAIIFPPFTEARLFPYLSLPMITAYLRSRAVSVQQIDINISLCHNLLTTEVMEKYCVGLDKNQLGDRYRLEMLAYAISHKEELFSSVFVKDQQTESIQGMQHDIRIVRQIIELLIENSTLNKIFTDFDSLIPLVEHAGAADDLCKEIIIKLVDEALTCNPKVVALSVTFFSQFVSTFFICRYIRKKKPSIKIILGGQQVMQWHKELVQREDIRGFIDALCTGPGEECLYEYISCIKTGSPLDSIPDFFDVSRMRATNIISNININKLPPPDYTGLPIHGYLSEETHLSIITCMGCYWGCCVFCSYGNRSYTKDNYQQGTAEWIANTVTTLIDKYGINRINFVDENTHLKYALKAAKIVKQKGYSLQFSTRNRLEKMLLDKSFCLQLADYGCVLMSVGYETNSQRLLDKLNKGVNSDNYQEIIDNLHASGIPMRLSIMGGILDESEDEFRESYKFLMHNSEKIGIDIMQMLVLEPNTILVENIKQYPIIQTDKPPLRGNEILNYSQGRLGHNFIYESGGDFNQRLNEFISIYNDITPRKNDEISPDRQTISGDKKIVLNSIELHPWVSIFSSIKDGVERYFISDLLWQNTYELDEFNFKRLNQQKVFLSISDVAGQEMGNSLLSLGMVKEVEEA